jgi:hypothetical protein
MSTRETATQRCSRCGRRFAVLADEAGDHPCPRCGLAPEDEYPDESAGYTTDEEVQQMFAEMDEREAG